MKTEKNSTVKKIKGVLWGMFSFALSSAEAQCGVYPFGLALEASSDENCFPIFLGCFASSLFGGQSGIVRSVISMAVFGSKWAIQRKRASVPRLVKLLLALSATGLMALYEFTNRNVLFESVMRAGIAFSVLPLFTVLLSLYSPLSGKAVFSDALRGISILAWVFSMVKALEILEISYFHPAIALGIFLSLYYARENAFFGGMCGFAAGLACGVVYIPVLTVAGLAYGIFCDEFKWFSVFFATFLSVTSGVYLASVSGAFPEFFNIFLGVFVFLAVRNKLKPIDKKSFLFADRGKNYKQMSAAFSALSQAFYAETAVKPTKADVSKEVKSMVFSCCSKCRSYSSCHIDKYDYVNHLCDVSSGTEDKLPFYMASSCPHSKSLCEKSVKYADLAIKADVKQTQLISEGYMSFARMLCSAGENAENNGINDREMTKKAAKVLKRLGIDYNTVAVTGKRMPAVCVYGESLSEIKLTPAEIRNAFSKELEKAFSSPEFRPCAMGWEMVLKAQPQIKIEYGKACASKEGESVSGDTAVTFESDDMMFYSLLADGMGSGKDASASSRLAAMFLEKLILAGGDKKEALVMLNKLLLTKKNEVFTTVDLLEIDRLSGEASLIKAGAAPTYLCRNERCYKIESNTPPAGVVSDMKIAQTTIRLQKGDVIIMISDGVLMQEFGVALINDRKSATVNASEILSAGENTPRADDMSVCVIKVRG